MSATPVEGGIHARRYKPFTVVLEFPRRQGDELVEVAARTSIEHRVISVTPLNETDDAKAQYAVSMPRGVFATVTGLQLASHELAVSELVYMILRDQMALSNSNVQPVSSPDDEQYPF